MDELDLIRELRPERELPGTTALLPARSVLLAAITTEQAEQPAVRTKARRRMLVGLAAAAAVAAGLVVAPWHGAHGPSAAADPMVILGDAAHYAAVQPFTPPRPDQFLYVAPDSWISIDGTHDGRYGDEIEPGCKNGKVKILKANNPVLVGTFQPCTPDPVYLADAPTTVPAMRAYLLAKNADGGADGLPNRLGSTVSNMFALYILSPAATAALFDTMTTLPGLRAIDDATTISGEHGVGITWTGPDGHAGDIMIFDRNTHKFLGVTSRGLKGELGGASQRPQLIVDRVGELPR